MNRTFYYYVCQGSTLQCAYSVLFYFVDGKSWNTESYRFYFSIHLMSSSWRNTNITMSNDSKQSKEKSRSNDINTNNQIHKEIDSILLYNVKWNWKTINEKTENNAIKIKMRSKWKKKKTRKQREKTAYRFKFEMEAIKWWKNKK